MRDTYPLTHILEESFILAVLPATHPSLLSRSRIRVLNEILGPPWSLTKLWNLGKIIPMLQRRNLRLRNEGLYE